MSFEDDLKTPVARDWSDVDVVLNGTLHVFRFTALDGLTWAAESDKCPMRPDVDFDRAYGYDIRKLTVAVAPLSGARLVDGELVPLRVDPVNPSHPNAPRVDEWGDLFARIDGHTFRKISDTIWGLNEYLPGEAVKAAKKALEGSGTPSASPSSSGSRPAGSSVGSRKKQPGMSTTTPDM